MQVNIKKFSKLIAAKKWNAATKLLSETISSVQISFREGDLAAPFTGVQWVLIDRAHCEFIFNKTMPKDRCQFFVTRLILVLPLIEAFHDSRYFHEGTIYINLDDSADAAGLAFCSNRKDSF